MRRTTRCSLERCSARDIQIYLVRGVDIERGPACRRVRRRGIRRIGANRDLRRDTRIVHRDEVAKNRHESALEVGFLVLVHRPEIGLHVLCVEGGGDGVLVLVRGATTVGEAFGHPVRGTHKGRFGVDVVGALLLAGREGGLVQCGGGGDAVCGEVGEGGINGGVGGGVVEQNLGDVGAGEEGEA